MHPATFHRLCRRLIVLKIPHEHARAAVEHFTRVANLELDLRHRRADRIGFHLPIGLHAHKHTGFCHAVELFDVNPERAVKRKDFRPDRLPCRVRQANAPKPQVVLEGPVNQELPDAVQQPLPGAGWLLGEHPAAHALRHIHKVVKDLAFDPTRIFNANHHRGQNIFPNARWGKEIGRADLVYIVQHRGPTFRAIHRKAGTIKHAVRKNMIPHPGHRQVGDDFLIVPQPFASNGMA